LNGSDPNNWDLRSTMIVPPVPPYRHADHRPGACHLWRGAADGAMLGTHNAKTPDRESESRGRGNNGAAHPLKADTQRHR